jgi:hypothetical protein
VKEDVTGATQTSVVDVLVASIYRDSSGISGLTKDDVVVDSVQLLEVDVVEEEVEVEVTSTEAGAEGTSTDADANAAATGDKDSTASSDTVKSGSEDAAAAGDAEKESEKDTETDEKSNSLGGDALGGDAPRRGLARRLSEASVGGGDTNTVTDISKRRTRVLPRAERKAREEAASARL